MTAPEAHPPHQLGGPAWSEPFDLERRAALQRAIPFQPVADRAWLDSRGAGVTVAVIDSGIEGNHPAVGGSLVRSVRVDIEGDEVAVVEDNPVDVVGHGTACAGIIHALAPEAELVSVCVLGRNMRGKGIAFAYGLDWVIQ